jgi:iron complex outermembrane receptor protein
VGFTGALFDLSPQTSTTWEVGLKHRSEHLSANVAFYWMNVEDEILFQHEIDAFGFPNPQNANIDRTRHRGIETWFSWRPWRQLEIYGSYTYDDATIVHDSTATLGDLDGNRFPITPIHRGNVGTILTVPLRFAELELGANVDVVGKRYVANDLLNEFAKLDDYWTVDLHATARRRIGAHVELALTGRALNVLNQHYVEFAGERTFVRNEIGYDPAPDTNYAFVASLTWRP